MTALAACRECHGTGIIAAPCRACEPCSHPREDPTVKYSLSVPDRRIVSSGDLASTGFVQDGEYGVAVRDMKTRFDANEVPE